MSPIPSTLLTVGATGTTGDVFWAIDAKFREPHQRMYNNLGITLNDNTTTYTTDSNVAYNAGEIVAVIDGNEFNIGVPTDFGDLVNRLSNLDIGIYALDDAGLLTVKGFHNYDSLMQDGVVVMNPDSVVQETNKPTQTEINRELALLNTFGTLRDAYALYGTAGMFPVTNSLGSKLLPVNLFGVSAAGLIAVDMATLGNITLSGIQNIDSQFGFAGAKVLVWNQTDATKNGVWVMDLGPWVRDTSSDTSGELHNQTVFANYPIAGSTYGGRYWNQITDNPVLGTDNIVYELGGIGAFGNKKFWKLTLNAADANSKLGTNNGFPLPFYTNNLYRGQFTTAGLFTVGQTVGATALGRIHAKGVSSGYALYTEMSGSAQQNWSIKDDGWMWTAGRQTAYVYGANYGGAFFGYGVADGLTDGVNTAFGTFAMGGGGLSGHENVAMGGYAGYNLGAGGDGNVFYGYNSGTDFSVAAFPPLIPRVGIVSGQNNTFMGQRSGASASNISQAIAIGCYAMVTANNQLILGGNADIAVYYGVNDVYIGQGVSLEPTQLAGGPPIPGQHSVNLQTTGISGVVGNTDVSAAAAYFAWCSAIGTGTGIGGDIRFYSAPAGSTGFARNALVRQIDWRGDGRGVNYYENVAGATAIANGVVNYMADRAGAGTMSPFWITEDGVTINLASLAIGGGTVTSFSAGNLSPLFTTAVATATSTPALTFALSTQTANLVFAGPASGGAVAPTFRALVSLDMPSTIDPAATLNIGTVTATVLNLGTGAANAFINIGTSGTNTINIGNANSTVNILGTTVYENVTNLDVSDKLITLNKGGGAASGGGTGFEIEENAIITGYIKVTGGRDGFLFKAPANAADSSFLLTATVARSYTFPNASGNVVVDSATQTLTNKSIDAGQLTGTVAAARFPADFAIGVLSCAAGNGSTIGASSTAYGQFFFGNSFASAEANRQGVMPYPCTIKYLYVRTSGPQSGTGNLVITIRKNGAATGLTLTIAAGAVAGTFTDLNGAHAFTVVAGDLLSIQFVNNATATSTPIFEVTCGTFL